MNEKNHIKAPFTKEQVINLNLYQFSKGMVHPFTCCSPDDIPECERRAKKSDGMLLADIEGWTCPCGKYKQDWAHAFMAGPKALEEMTLFMNNNNVQDFINHGPNRPFDKDLEK